MIHRRNNARKRMELYSTDYNNEASDVLATRTIVRRTKQRKMPKYLKVCLSIVGVYLLFAFLAGGYQIWQLKQQMNNLEEEQRILLQKQEGLINEVESLSDTEMIEKIARENLGMVKMGETIIIPAIPERNLPTTKEVQQEDMGD